MSLLKVAGTTASSGQLYSNDVFSTYLYTGNGSTQTITNGIDLAGKGGLVWTKVRTTTYPHCLTDTIRGGNKQLFSNTTDASTTSSPAEVTSFNSDGYTLAGGTIENISGQNFVGWTFREAAKFFDVVTYTGTGSARTIAHSLGVAPGMVIVKRTDTTGNWQVYSNGLTSAAYSIQLNLTAAQASAPTVWNSTAPTSSVFSVGTDATVNASGGTYVAYLFAHDTSSTGIIQCGGLTTNVSGVANINLGWQPQYFLYKNIDSAVRDWNIVDTMRGFTVNSAEVALYANSSAAESTYGNNVPTATGITFDGNASSKYIYMAIRIPNKPPTSGTQVYNAIARTGNSPTVNSITSIGFPPDSIWQKRVSGSTASANVFDRLIGRYFLAPANTNAETAANTSTTRDLISFDMTGFTVGEQWSSELNANTRPEVYWNFKRAPGFFDEVCYTGTGVARTVAHNLTVVPELMILKSRGGATDWVVYDAYANLSNTYELLVLNTTGARGFNSLAVNSTVPTSSVFTVGPSGFGVNNTSETYVAYLFATLAGISKVGSYTGNGTGQVIACGFSAGARFVLIKRTDSTGGWYTFDSARGLTVGSSPYLLLNSTAAEVTGNNGVYASTGGFTLDATAITTTNIATATYIFLAVA
jgi:hypothetical protein